MLLSTLTNDLAEQIKLPDGKVQALLSVLSSQAAEVEDIYSKTSYRLAATTAYLNILTSRLDRMQMTRLSGFQGVRGFLDRRMAPAMQSCSAFSERLASLSRRISRAGELLRTQTELVIQRQNRDLLKSMDERAKHQLRLQQMVERLSIAAVTYYGVGLVGYVAVSLANCRMGGVIDRYQGCVGAGYCLFGLGSHPAGQRYCHSARQIARPS